MGGERRYQNNGEDNQSGRKSYQKERDDIVATRRKTYNNIRILKGSRKRRYQIVESSFEEWEKELPGYGGGQNKGNDKARRKKHYHNLKYA